MPQPDSTILMCGDRIVRTGPSGLVHVSDGATIVDPRGKFVIPGLADIHTHGLAYEQIDPALSVANGVTTVSGGGLPVPQVNVRAAAPAPAAG